MSNETNDFDTLSPRRHKFENKCQISFPFEGNDEPMLTKAVRSVPTTMMARTCDKRCSVRDAFGRVAVGYVPGEWSGQKHMRWSKLNVSVR